MIRSAAPILPGTAVWLPLLALILAPLASFLVYGFFYVENNEVQREFALATYAEALSNPSYMRTFGRTMGLSLQVALICLILGYATAYFVWCRPKAWRGPLLFLLAAPLLMSYVIRIYAMRGLLGTNGLLNSLLMGIGVVDAPVTALLFNLTAVKLTLIVILLPFATLPTYVALERIPASLLQASSDLGAGEWRTFRSVILPLSLPGAVVGAMFTFVLASGDFLAPELVGGIEGFTYGRLVFSQFGLAFNWPLGAALSVLLLAVALCVIFAARAVGGAKWQSRTRPPHKGGAPKADAARTGFWGPSRGLFFWRFMRRSLWFLFCPFSAPGAGRCNGTAFRSIGIESCSPMRISPRRWSILWPLGSRRRSRP